MRKFTWNLYLLREYHTLCMFIAYIDWLPHHEPLACEGYGQFKFNACVGQSRNVW